MPILKRERERHLTTGEAAGYVGITTTKMRQLVDAGRVGGFLIPGFRCRRVSADSLRALMVRIVMPTEALDARRSG